MIPKTRGISGRYGWWQPEIRWTHQLRLVVYPIFFRVWYIPGGAGFLSSTVWMFIISFGAWILYISQHETKESSCWSFPFDKVRWQMEESLCSIGTSTRNHRITIAMCLYQKTEGNHSRRCSSNGHRSVTDGIPLQSFAFKVKWVLLPLNVDDEGLRRHNLYTTHVFFFRAIYRPFSPDIIPFRVWNSYPFLDGFFPQSKNLVEKLPQRSPPSSRCDFDQLCCQRCQCSRGKLSLE